uniref:Translocation protein SEC62 n=1 Tax=Hirondellea gigas TaxID=1518452 RepID=A0A6A7FNJ5_9CRUS
MSTQKKLKKKGQDVPAETAKDEPSKLDYSIASYMKKHTPTKRTKFLHHQVNYFTASKAIEVLLDSQWATGKQPLFTDRQSVVDYCNRLLTAKFFHRAKKIAVTDKDLKPKELKKKRERELREKNKKEKEVKKKKTESKDDGNDSKKEEDAHNEDEHDENKKKKKKIKLDMHLEQVFVDGNDAYIWMYDPVPFWYYVAGAGCLLAAVAICLFPLWPPSVRVGVYYLSVAAAGFLGFILSLAVIRFVVFLIIWVLSMGRHHLWLLPNLTEDVGFFASFWPLYHYEYRGADFDRKKSKKGKKKVVLPSAEAEDDDNKRSEKEALNDGSGWETEERIETDAERHDECSGSNRSNSDTETDQHSQPFEMVDKNDLEENTDHNDEEDDSEQKQDQTGDEDQQEESDARNEDT